MKEKLNNNRPTTDLSTPAPNPRQCRKKTTQRGAPISSLLLMETFSARLVLLWGQWQVAPEGGERKQHGVLIHLRAAANPR